MNKTFKKAIAVILSVLMVVLSVPFTALAAPGDYAPNAKLSFGMFTEASATSFTDYSTSGTAASDFGSYASLYGVPVDYNYKVVDGNKTSGSLSINKDKANTYIDAAGLSYDKLSQDLQLGVGDYFTMTLSLEGMSNLCAFVAQIQFSDSIEPAGVYSYKSGRKMVYALGTENERVAKNGAWVADKGGTTFLPTYSLCSTGIDKNSFNPEFDPNSSKVKANDEDGKMNVISYEFGSAGSSTASLSDPDGYFVNPETGEPGYTFTNNPPMATFVFKIVTADPIEFNVYHPSELNSIALAADTSEVQSQYKTTYAKNAWNDKTNTNDGDVEHPGSKKFTFMGFNEFREAPKPSTHTITFTPYGGEPTTQTVNDGAMPTIPANTATTAPTPVDSTHHSVTSYKWTPEVVAATADAAYTEEAVVAKSECPFTVTEHKDATYKEAGYDVLTCPDCGNSYKKVIDKLVCDHADTKVVNATKPTINNPGNTGDTVCNVCGETIATGTVIAQLKGEAYRAALKAAQDATVDPSKYTADSYAKVTEAIAAYDEATVGAYTTQEDVDAATAALKAAVKDLVANPTTETYTYNFIDGTSKPLTVNKGETPENFANTPAKVTDNKNGTHTTTTYTWSQDGFVFTEVGSDKVDDCTLKYETVTQPTIKVEGSKTATCPDCGYVSTLPIDKLNGTEYYNALEAAQNVKADDFTAASYAKVAEALKANAQATVEAYTTQEAVDAATAALKDAVAKLDAGVVVTVASTKLGTTTLNGADATNGANARLAVGDDVVLTAKANNETGEFVGWKVGNKIVSDEATFKTAATADITYEAVFAEKADTSFTVVFVDPYGNVIDTQTVDSAADITVPTEPVFPGYTFTGWSMTQEQISKLTDGATIYAQYKKDDVAKYTVTANDGATITVNGAEVASPAQVAYDTKVSVHKDGAEAWKLADGTVVGYGDTYTFFCGSDIELTPVMTAVQQKTTVKILSATPIEGTVKVSFLATRNIAPGETVVKQGFVYGKNLADSELTLDNVGNKGADANAGTVKILYNKNSAEQIALDYGLSKKDGKISAVAFVITKTADGTLKPTMSNIESYTY